MNVLAIDVGGTNLKILATGEEERRKVPSGPRMTAGRMVSEAKKLAKDFQYDVVSIGYPGPVYDGRPMAEPRNLGAGWVDFDFEKAFGCPVKIINDAAMQALGSYHNGKMLFLGLGTGLGSCAVVNGKVGSLELAHLPYKKWTYEHYVGRRRLEHRGRKKWSKDVAEVVGHLIKALHPSDVVLGGGNAKKLAVLPKGCRLGSNANAFIGGFRLWEEESKGNGKPKQKKSSARKSRSVHGT
jgi:polyphosphate glucokinase